MRKNSLAFLVNNYCNLPINLRDDIVSDIYDNGVELSWIQDAIHFNYYPLGEKGSRPDVMLTLGRGIEKYSAIERLDRSSIVLGFNGTQIDYPDLCDVFIESAKCRFTGLELPEAMLDELSDDHELKMEALV
jgi:hypothetical protein